MHHLPSGILTEGVLTLIPPGVVLNPPVVLAEISGLMERGVAAGERLLISPRAHVVFPWHIAEDKALSADKVGGEGIGTTLRGIGPCYRDKYGRLASIRLGDMVSDRFRERIERVVALKRRELCGFGDLIDKSALDGTAIFNEYRTYAEQLAPMVGDTTLRLHDALEAQRTVLFEGAQGSMLDVDHGTYPFVTSSNSSGVGICPGSGVPPQWIDKVYGVAKASSTRFGGGPFPTELHAEVG